MKLASLNGDVLDATFSVEPMASGKKLVFESRGPNRNLDYTEGMHTLLERLSALDTVLVDAYLDTRETQRQKLTQAQRRLDLPDGATYPHPLGRTAVDALVSTLKSSQRRIGQPAGATGGNDTRRVVMKVRPGPVPLPAFLEAVLAGSSPRAGVVYVPGTRQGSSNLATGLDREVWGLSRTSMQRSTYLRDFRLLREGDTLFLGHRGPSPRVAAGGWAGEQVEVGHLGLITGIEENARGRVWPDGRYPYRLHVNVLGECRDFGAANVGKEVMDALRLSANQQGRVIVLPLGDLVLAGGADRVGVPLDLDGPLDRLVARAHRREQSMLRKQRLGGLSSAECDLCGRSFPIRFLRMAHIKKRSQCSDTEKLDPNVVMTACIECDALFEAGEIVVDAAGVIQAAGRIDATTDLKRLLKARTGSKCTAFSKSTRTYFEFHRASFG